MAPTRGKWTEAELERLLELEGSIGESELAQTLGRSPESVRRKLRELRPGTRRGAWSEAEEQRLRRMVGLYDAAWMARELGRGESEVRAKLRELAAVQRDGAWSLDELQLLKSIYGTRTDEDLCLVLARPIESIRSVARRLCLAKDKAFLRRLRGEPSATTMPRWGKEELATLRKLYPGHSNLEIARRLGRSVKSVVSKAHHMGLKKQIVRLREMGRENVRLRHARRELGEEL